MRPESNESHYISQIRSCNFEKTKESRFFSFRCDIFRTSNCCQHQHWSWGSSCVRQEHYYVEVDLVLVVGSSPYFHIIWRIIVSYMHTYRAITSGTWYLVWYMIATGICHRVHTRERMNWDIRAKKCLVFWILKLPTWLVFLKGMMVGVITNRYMYNIYGSRTCICFYCVFIISF